MCAHTHSSQCASQEQKAKVENRIRALETSTQPPVSLAHIQRRAVRTGASDPPSDYLLNDARSAQEGTLRVTVISTTARSAIVPRRLDPDFWRDWTLTTTAVVKLGKVISVPFPIQSCYCQSDATPPPKADTSHGRLGLCPDPGEQGTKTASRSSAAIVLESSKDGGGQGSRTHSMGYALRRTRRRP